MSHPMTSIDVLLWSSLGIIHNLERLMPQVFGMYLQLLL